MDFEFGYDFLSEIEAGYIVGDFGVKIVGHSEGEIIDEPDILSNGTWVDKGYPFYSGVIRYSTECSLQSVGKRFVLRLLNPSGTLFKIRVKWRPYEIDITGSVRPGQNSIEIDVFSSLQNTCGPLHQIEGEENVGIGPHCFEVASLVRRELSLMDYGLFGGCRGLSRIRNHFGIQRGSERGLSFRRSIGKKTQLSPGDTLEPEPILGGLYHNYRTKAARTHGFSIFVSQSHDFRAIALLRIAHYWGNVPNVILELSIYNGRA